MDKISYDDVDIGGWIRYHHNDDEVWLTYDHHDHDGKAGGWRVKGEVACDIL